MTTLDTLLFLPWMVKIGSVLVHFLWQGAAIALVLAVVLRFMRRRMPQGRWLVSCLALAAVVAAPIVTACLVFSGGAALLAPSADAKASDSAKATPDKSADKPAAPVVGGRGTTPAAPLPGAVVVPTPVVEHRAGPQPVTPPAATEDLVGKPAAPATVPWSERAYGLLQPILPWVSLAWAAGVMGIGLWHLGGWLQTRRLRRRRTRPVSEAVLHMVSRLGRRLKVSRPVRVLESALARVPMVIGWLRPVILLPASALAGLTPEQLEAVLAHELAHIRRYDCLVRLVQVLAETLLFYHPAVWWISSRIRTESEYCCDEMAAVACGNRRQYALAMAALAELQDAAPRLAAAASGGPLLGRVRRVMGMPDPVRPSVAASAAAILLVVAMVAIPIAIGVSSGGTGVMPAAPATEPAKELTLDLGDRVTMKLVLIPAGKFMMG